MSQIDVNIPHQLGKDAAKARLDGGIGKIGKVIPGGSITEQRWDGDTLHFKVEAMGQALATRATVSDANVHMIVDVPMFLAMFSGKIREVLQQEAPKLLR
ncbi:polyhydroxyalkanoic acid system family protein [Sphingomonas sp. GV3]|uniref:polyhydroxyalkanoic acid system family protein n=1 Tax=Sphingomonas sp. GV3 TaxID=3040671 RepID=UPI00280C2856|nr:polyhydroxyalkanoic acid system family protein [Sphingomonas sp. GV3]